MDDNSLRGSGLGSNMYFHLYLNIDFLFELKITKWHVVVFDNWSVFEKNLQIQSITYTKLPTKDKLAQEAAQRILAYCEAGQHWHQ